MPDAPVVLYDGNCGVCRDWSRRLAEWDDARPHPPGAHTRSVARWPGFP